MNHFYRIIWSNTTATYIAVAESTGCRGKRSLGKRMRTVRALAAASAILASAPVLAAPVGGQVSTGTGSISQNGTTTTITQGTQKLAVNWQSFNVGADETVNFVQPNSNSVALNRVLGADGSKILGRLNANGQVYLINPNGVLFGQGAQVSVGGLVASTLQMSDADFVAGKTTFSGNGAAVVNQGSIVANGKNGKGGYVVLLGSKVSNEGVIAAKLGTIAVGAGKQATLDFTGDGLLNLTIDQAAVNALAENHGLIQADGGKVVMSAKAADALLATVVNNDGVIRARTLENRNGTIQLLGGMDAGTVKVAGTLDASAPNGGNGGFIDTSGANVHVASGTKVTTAAPNGKAGDWLIDPDNYTVAASGGNITGAALSASLATTNITIQSSSGTPGGSGDININDNISWGANKLTLTAAHDINVNAVVSVTGTGSLTMNTSNGNGGDSAVAGGTVNVKLGSNGFTGRVDFSGSGQLTINGKRYTIIQDVNALQAMSNNLTGYYALGSNIDASATAGWNGGAGFAPVGTYVTANDYSTSFKGTIDGLGHTVNNLKINRPGSTFVGLLGIASNATIRNIGVTGVTVSMSGIAGGLVGFNRGGTISNVFSTGTISGTGSEIGGLAGRNYGTINNAYSSGTVTSSGGILVGGLVGTNSDDVDTSTGYIVTHSHGVLNNVYSTATVSASSNTTLGTGGLAGRNINNAAITNAYSTGSVSGKNAVGGLVGMNQGGTIGNSYSLGNVNGSSYVGGLVGQNGNSSMILYDGRIRITQTYFKIGSINNSYSSGAVTGVSNVGGLAGQNRGATIANAYSTGSVNGTSFAGGLIGRNEDNTVNYTVYETGAQRSVYQPSSISNTYSTGSVAASTDVGGLVGYTDRTNAITGSFWNIDTSGRGTSAGGTGKSNTDMLRLATYGGWNVSSQGGSSAVWRIYDGYTTPLLRSFLTSASVQANNLTTTYNGTDQSTSITVAGAGINTSLIQAGALGARNVGTYSVGRNLYSTQQGYDLSYTAGTLTINKAPVTVTSIAANNKVYDGTVSAVLNLGTAVLSGMVQGDSLSLATASGQFVDKNAGIGKTVNVTGLTLSGTDAGNYSLTSTTATSTADIAKATLTASGITANSKVYDGTTAASFDTRNGVLAGVVAGDTVTINSVSGSFADKNAGSGRAVNITGITLAGGDAGNYAIAGTATTANIAQLAINGDITVASKTYDGTATAVITGRNLSGVIAGDDVSYVGGTAGFADKNAGASKTVTAMGLGLSGTDSGNYTVNSTAVTSADITKAAISNVSGITAASKTYDGTTAATLNTANANFNGGIAGDDLVVTTASGSFADKNAGVGKMVYISGITLGGSDAGNYTVNTTAFTTADIGKAVLTVSGVVANNKVYDGTTTATFNLANTRLSGIVGADTVSLNGMTGNFSDPKAGTAKPVTVTSSSLSGADSGNYSLINPAGLTANIYFPGSTQASAGVTTTP